jgi:CDP-glycerol glycerophosphotransferase (TagB/SpsB family)
MKKLWTEIKYWSQLFLLPVYLLSFIVPRDKGLWVFGSTFGRRFADNPKYFYLYMTQHQSEQVKVVWISKSKNVIQQLNEHEASGYYLYSLKGIWHALRAKVYIYDNYSKDICYALSGRAVKINLWHGIPLKMIQKDNKNDKVRNPVSFAEKLHGIPRRISDEKPSHYVVTTSEFLIPFFRSAFQTEKVINCGGYPRNDILLSKDIRNLLTGQELSSLEEIKNKRAALDSEAGKLVLYMPTFRESEKLFLQMLDINQFNEVLRKKNILFCIKLHPKSKQKDEILKLSNDNIIILASDSDPYVFLDMADLLITDYSSVYFDYLLADKPLIFFCYDLEEYISNSRDMYFNYEEFTPGMKIKTMEEFLDVLSVIDKLPEEEAIKTKRTQIRNTVFDHSDGSASERLFRYIQDRIIKK